MGDFNNLLPENRFKTCDWTFKSDHNLDARGELYCKIKKIFQSTTTAYDRITENLEITLCLFQSIIKLKKLSVDEI